MESNEVLEEFEHEDDFWDEVLDFSRDEIEMDQVVFYPKQN